jgi:hypothetical protein
MAAARRLTGSAVVFGTDHEDFGSNEHPSDNLRPIDKLLFAGQGSIGIGIAPVRWGGECRVEVDFEAEVFAEEDNAIRVRGSARFFEGGSEDTSELEDARGFEFSVPRRVGNSPPIGFSVPLRNSTILGAEDHAEVVFSLSNIIAETE